MRRGKLCVLLAVLGTVFCVCVWIVIYNVQFFHDVNFQLFAFAAGVVAFIVAVNMLILVVQAIDQFVFRRRNGIGEGKKHE